jgi:hypothetical protein
MGESNLSYLYFFERWMKMSENDVERVWHYVMSRDVVTPGEISEALGISIEETISIVKEFMQAGKFHTLNE